ncbi:EAL domain-containing protein [Alcaligenaceae bacterium A4P071]|nr:EAL domain-containing protein [Alcaligenaceae bacterium C4P045]MDQ2184893.1 EAL domain-containing protein [Alcaligenaceae bacterium A4P071]
MKDDSNVMYRLLVESVVDYAIYMLLPDGTVANWNAGAQRAKGYTRDEIVGKHFSCFYGPEDRALGVPQRGLKTATDTGRFEAEGWRYRKDGTAFWAHVVIDAVKDAAGTLIGFAKITRDCTEQRRRQAEQMEEERKFRLLVQGVTDYAIYMLDPSGCIVNWNAGAQRAKGYLEHEIVGRHFSCFYGEEDRRAGLPEAGLETARSTGRFAGEGLRYRKDGSAFWSAVVIDAIRDESGEIIGFAKVTRDITERRAYEQQLLQAKELAEQHSERTAALSIFLDTVIANIPSCVMVLDAVTREILLVNRHAETLFGHRRDELIGAKPIDCMAPRLSGYIERLSDAALRTEGRHKNEGQVETAQGPRMLRTTTMVIRGADSRTSYVLLIADDVTDEHAANARIHHMAHHDNLTSLPNRELFRQRLDNALDETRSSPRMTATLCLDLDNFKHVNDALGHQVGDELLRAIASRLRKVLREQDTLARVGGDEFAIVLPGLKSEEDAHLTARRLIEAVRPSLIVDGHTLSVGLSVGIAMTGSGMDSSDELLRSADMALYEAKHNGRNRFEVFRAEMDESARKRREIEIDLREAISQGHFALHYQPITDKHHERVVGYEALLRWHHPVKGMIMPMDFIPIAEETGLIHNIGAWALYDACREAARWPNDQTVAVNLSPIQFKNAGFVAMVESALNDAGLPPTRLELEITESVMLDSTQGNLEILRQLKAMGVRIALDDFGTGYSSLSYLRSFPFDKIKIDKSFIHDMKKSPEALAIIRAITGMSRSLAIETTAEGVETLDQFDQLKNEGCSLFQGYFFGRPQPVSLLLKGFESAAVV